MNAFPSMTLAEIALRFPLSTPILEKYHLDFCCGGKQTLDDACAEKMIPTDSVCKELLNLSETRSDAESGKNFETMDPGLLADYIEYHHHGYVRNEIRRITGHLEKLVRVHGERHPELRTVKTVFEDVAMEMQMHMQKEEFLIFPYVKAMTQGHDVNVPFPSVQNPIAVMESEHEHAGAGMKKIREVTRDYTLPADACTTYQVTFASLQEFERDLHQHVHLENNLLFPKAIAMETARKAVADMPAACCVVRKPN